jgi:hypothetical protein
MRPLAEIKKRVTGDIRKLNTRLLVTSNQIAIKLQEHAIARTPQGRILVALFKKAVNTFRGIQMLKSDRLIEESLVLLRVLLETHINTIYFLRSGDGVELTRRSADAAMLDKLKYLKEVNFFEHTPLENLNRRADWEAAEAEITARYSKAELHAIRRNGYSGLSVQQRAEAIGLGSMYSHCYRITSRSVHVFDPTETGMMDYLKDDAEVEELLKLRRSMLDDVQNLLLGRLAFLISEIVDDAFISLRIMALGIGYEKYRDRDGEAAADNAGADPETFYLWRE